MRDHFVVRSEKQDHNVSDISTLGSRIWNLGSRFSLLGSKPYFRTMQIALFFGSFNPVHVGHLIIAQSILDLDFIQQLWFVVSPQNPFKQKKSLLAERQRYNLLKMATENNDQLKVSDIEFGLPKPSYTIDTLAYMEEKYPQQKFHLVMGSDNLTHLHKWKNADVLKANYPIIVYPRPDHPVTEHADIQLTVIEAPLLNISSTFIRKRIKAKQNINFYLPESVTKYVDEMGFYK